MKPFKKFISLITAAAVTVSAAAASMIAAAAVVTVSDGVFEYTYSNGAWQLYAYIGNDTELTLPESYSGSPVNGICNQCFANSSVTSVAVPNSYTTIGNYAFYGCESLRSVSLPDTIGEIGMGAFAESGVTNIDLSEMKLDIISNYLFKSCKSLESVKLPSTVTSIGEAAFAECAINSVDIPDNVTALGRNAFANTSALTTVTLPAGLESIGDSCFENSAISSIDLPESLETIGNSAFRSAYSLTELYIPSSVISIGAYAFFPMSIQSAIEVTCFKNTYAETYCYENFVRNTKTVEKIAGDANLDGVVNVIDVTAIQRDCTELETLDRAGKFNADANHDGVVSIDDATLIQRMLAEFDGAEL